MDFSSRGKIDVSFKKLNMDFPVKRKDGRFL